MKNVKSILVSVKDKFYLHFCWEMQMYIYQRDFCVFSGKKRENRENELEETSSIRYKVILPGSY